MAQRHAPEGAQWLAERVATRQVGRRERNQGCDPAGDLQHDVLPVPDLVVDDGDTGVELGGSMRIDQPGCRGPRSRAGEESFDDDF